MIEKKLNLLKQNLEKKEELIDKLLEINEKQLAVLEGVSLDLEIFDGFMNEQDVYVQELIGLNEDTDELYQELSGEEFTNDDKGGMLIGRIKEIISRLREKTDLLQEKEQICKQKLAKHFQEERQSFGTGRRTSKAALDYYKSMNRSNVVPPQFMDRKK